MKPTEKLDAKPRTLSELALAYGNIDKRTFKQWLLCNELKHIKPHGNYFLISQIKEIINHLGEP